MSWFQTGWKATSEEGAKSPFENKGPRRFWLPPDKDAQIVFIDEDPTGMWEHSYQKGGEWGHFEPCKTKNKMDDRCPICSSGDKMFPQYVNFFTVINLSSWFTKKENREMSLMREVFACRTGSAEKPGVFKKIDRIRQEEGRLRGLVLKAYRSGKKTESVGDEFRVVDRLDAATLEEIGRKRVAEYVARVNEKLPGKDHLQVGKTYDRNPWKPINFEKLFETDWKPKSLEELDRLFSRGGGAGGGSKDSGGEGDSGGGDADDIPY